MAENNQANAPAQEQDLSEILKVRRERLAAPVSYTHLDVYKRQILTREFPERALISVTVSCA